VSGHPSQAIPDLPAVVALLTMGVEEAFFMEVLNQNGHSLSNQPGTGSIHFVQLIFQDSFEVSDWKAPESQLINQ
jgi:hypothetical protein